MHRSHSTLSFVRRLESAGMDTQQAEALAEALNEIVFETTATKSDLKELELKVAADIKAVELKIAELENRLTVRLGGMLAGSTALSVGILGALIAFK